MNTVASGPTTRERLLSSTLELVAEGGYAAANVVAITSRAGVAAGTLYRHFASKEELFVELFREMCGREVVAMQEAADTRVAPLEKLDAAIETFARRALVHPRVSWALLAEPVDPLVDAERLEYRRRYRDLVAMLLRSAIAERAIPACDAELTAAAIVGGVGEALVGPLSGNRAGRAATDEELVGEIRSFARRAAG